VKITKIKQQVKRPDRYSIFVDEKYSFSLGESELINSGIRLGLEVSEGQLEEFKNVAAIDKGYDRTLNLISIRRRSRWEIEQYLKRKDYSPALTEAILNKLSNNYIDDLAFARAWVSNRRLLKAISKRKLSLELRAKRISDEIVRQVLADDETDEQEVLRELVAKKRKISRFQDDLKLMQYLSRQGYNYDDIKKAINVD
jgi:regulatory protein